MKEPISAYLQRSARILADCADLLVRIEDGIAPLMTRAPGQAVGDGGPPGAMRNPPVSLQSIDLLSQTLEDLALWLEGLASEADLNGPLTLDASGALARLRLADLRQRLQGESLGAEAAPSEPMLF